MYKRQVVDNLTKGVYCFIETGVNANSGYILDADTAYEFSIDDKGAMVIVPEADRKNQGPNNTTVVYNAVDNATLTVVNYKPDFNKCTTKKDVYKRQTIHTMPIKAWLRIKHPPVTQMEHRC